MTTEKKAVKVTPKSFINKFSGKVSALAYIQAHKAWLETGELSEVASPIINKLELGEILPSPALSELFRLALMHTGEKENQKAPSGYTVRIVDQAGNLQFDDNGDPLEKGCDMYSQAERWADRRLFDGSPDWHATITHISIAALNSEISRQESVARTLKRPIGPVSRGAPKNDSRASFGVKCRNDHFNFSRG